MHVDHARKLFPVAVGFVRLEVRALERVAELVFQFDICPNDTHGIENEIVWAQIFWIILKPWWPNNCLPESTITFDFHFFFLLKLLI